MADRKQVPEDQRIAIAAEIRELLARMQPGPGHEQSRVWTQTSLGTAIGLSQEAVRRARQPNGVTPAVRNGILNLTGQTAAGLIAKHAEFADEYRRRENWLELSDEARARSRLFTLPSKQRVLKDEATEKLVRAGHPLPLSRQAVEAVALFLAKEEPELNIADMLVLAEALIKTYLKSRSKRPTGKKQ